MRARDHVVQGQGIGHGSRLAAEPAHELLGQDMSTYSTMLVSARR